MTETCTNRRIILVAPSLSAGGAQRVIAEMANHWAEQGWAVSLVTLAGSQDDFFPLHSKVERSGLDLIADSGGWFNALQNNWHRVRQLRSALLSANPHVIISFVDQTNVLTLLAARRLRIPVIVAERTDPRHHSVGRVWETLRKLTYRWSAAVVVQTDRVRQYVENKVVRGRARVIANAVSAPAAVDKRSHGGEQLVVCGVGRLSFEKGFDRLVEAFGSISTDFPEWRLVISGDGPERARLEELAAHRAPGAVEFPGWETDVASRYQQAALFALPSRYEGFPNALLEAMSYGLPAVCFDCESGPSEIVRHEVDGLLIAPDDVRGLAQALARLMADKPLREQFRQRAVQVTDRFSSGRFFDSWKALIDEVTY